MNRLKFAGLAFALLICGCFGSTSETLVNGTLTIDGQPMENVLVTFHPVEDPDTKNLIASGVTNADGEFTLKRDGGDEPNLAVGSYAVTLTEGAIPDSVASSDDPLAAQTYSLSLDHRPLPVVYGRHVDTPLKVDVVGGKTNYALEIEKPN
ncbi:transthyretin-like family protein [Mariniblastus sp.]|nr:transthyretin-like family protein [Mariniblastus sp.]